MTDEEQRYDRIAEGYARRWLPASAGDARPASEIDAAVAAGATRVLDIGCGHGALVAAAVGRWRDVRVTGEVPPPGRWPWRPASWGAHASPRPRVTGPGDRGPLPFDDGGFDIVLTAFVLQLGPSRYQALREASGSGTGRDAGAGHVAAGGRSRRRRRDRTRLVAAGLEPRDGTRPRRPGSPVAAAAQLRRAGFPASRRVRVRWTAGSPGGLPRKFLAASTDQVARSPPWSPQLRERRSRPTSWNACARSRSRACGCGSRSRGRGDGAAPTRSDDHAPVAGHRPTWSTTAAAVLVQDGWALATIRRRAGWAARPWSALGGGLGRTLDRPRRHPPGRRLGHDGSSTRGASTGDDVVRLRLDRHAFRASETGATVIVLS